jgi:hypothetical protein
LDGRDLSTVLRSLNTTTGRNGRTVNGVGQLGREWTCSIGKGKASIVTVTVTLPDGATDKFMRFGDVYVKHHDGSLDVIRGGAKEPYSYASGQWTDVKGDEKRWKKGRFWS